MPNDSPSANNSEYPLQLPLTLAIPTIPCQQWNGTYDLAKGLETGTIFPDLDMPFFLGGVHYGR